MSFLFLVEDCDFLELSGIFGHLFSEALDIIDLDKVTIHKSPLHHRKYIEIIEDQSSIWKLLPNINYCACITFKTKVIASNELYTCQHVLASKLALIIGKTKLKRAVTNEAFAFSIRMIKPMSTILTDD